LMSMSAPLTSPRSKPPAQITNFPESLSKLTKINHHYSITKIRNIILSVNITEIYHVQIFSFILF
jgi:hypothetical protein